MTFSSRRKAKRSKTISSVDLEIPTFDARNVDLNNPININKDDEDEEVELPRLPGRRSGKNGGRAESSSAGVGMKQDFEEMNRRLQDIRDLGHWRLETMQERKAENKKFVVLQEARQMEKDIEFMSKPINHLQGEALLLAQMCRQQICDKYEL
ncbi:hypothetical protein HanHA300_Chr15g0557541 [Helianthus annuus]|nr:hypothetical protein HanHA300_Chr15g0557541 [Helianthus annuus]KAJ0472398.1 hypothetical protein HanHA89_Chr15g0606631 [Helianthus annuus]KAJ0647998.1 hypothetical protein HanLR1_Chr15g0567981 [Helianthus annuus]KAJ0651850.1 hypothetical protein HanOQP8_Chr15g0565551 [Helianthus annuus]KAJ0830505.1 hypothetical protein HanPSC8_Chr15g0656211 [Helianthus annuus]